MEWIKQPWPWYVAGPLISLVMFLLLYFGQTFGISSNLRTLCTVAGAGKFADFFRFDWKTQIWNLVFVFGAIIGGAIAVQWMTPDTSIALSEGVIIELQGYGIAQPGKEYVPSELFSWENLLSVQGIFMLVTGGIMVGFGTRYAGGCTSGHAITGLSNLQIPSLIAVVGFFIGGLIMTYLVLPFILTI